MGDKVEAKRTAGALGLPLVPGSDGAISDVAEAQALAEQIGYPVTVSYTHLTLPTKRIV